MLMGVQKKSDEDIGLNCYKLPLIEIILYKCVALILKNDRDSRNS